ncbi:hypothetical protein [Mycolicibacterium celeriflavum]|uniref:Uncharacterized protein n=1 Tax=Mycolicibacterium celeriflavum TaxID=1249101 RepID=A0A1X0C0G2_MYCCF|nr:hypothetical protein [Mycolicibacterium celeriflavum]MCV7237711.1 hypothetical protein [Mycolicibacterium celeriflavum]ORA49979.1 hypothetical protein BST21_05470 [Mycolicibacterium celeriflavum]BBY42183.1 hypothetical protein MCEL_04780 [Mycolicibacterium celeriflavum]
MAFTIHYMRADRVSSDRYDDSHSLVVKDWGLIEVTKDGEQVKLYSPNYWSYVTPGEPPKTASPRTGGTIY